MVVHRIGVVLERCWTPGRRAPGVVDSNRSSGAAAAASKLKEEFGQRAVNIEDRLKVIGMEIYQKRVDTAIDILEGDAFPRLAVGDLISFILNHGLDHLPRVILKEL